MIFRVVSHKLGVIDMSLGTLRYEDGKLGQGRDWKSRTGTGPIVPAKNKKLKNVHFRAGRRRQ